MFEHNKNFYPTPPSLIAKMLRKIKGHPVKVLEPSAGKGDIVEAIKERFSSRYGYSGPDVFTMETDPDLQACLRGKGIKMLDTDFLAYTGPDKFDAIIANPPFDEGEKHLLKALDIMYRGQIVFLLNAETIRNPFSNTRKLLARRLEESGATIEFIPDAFIDAERQTFVEVALIYVQIERKVEDDLFAGAEDWSPDAKEEFREKHEVATGHTITELVAEYNEIIQAGTDTIVSYYRNYRKIGKYLKLNDHDNKMRTYNTEDLTTMMQGDLNDLLRTVRTSFWRRTLDLQEVRSRLTTKKQEEFEEGLKLHQNMDFTEGNIRQFVLNLISGYKDTITDAIEDLFDMFTVRHCCERGEYEKNIWMFNGWKTNKAFKVQKRIVVPIGYRGTWDGPFTNFKGEWNLNHSAAQKLRDIDVVMNSLDGGGDYLSMSQALRDAFSLGVSSGIESTYFRMTTHKKGTIHLTFKDENILRRFNVIACKSKNWLPGDFGAKAYQELTFEERVVVNSFEGEESYEKNRNTPLFGHAFPNLLSLPSALMLQPDSGSKAADNCTTEEQSICF